MIHVSFENNIHYLAVEKILHKRMMGIYGDYRENTRLCKQ